MEQLIDQLPYAGAIVSIVIFVLGLAASMYMLDAYRGRKKNDKDNADDRLNGILEKTVKELGGKVDALERREKELTKEVSELRKDNERLLAILQGRDAQTQKFYEQGFESMKTTSEMFETITKLVKCVTDLSQSIEKNNDMTSDFVKTLKEHFLNIEKSALNNNKK